jgi:SAM-dependent methyltransferase
VTLDDWLRIRGVEDVISFHQVSGKVKYQDFDSGEFNKRKILTALQREFPNARSVAEYGCGIGRNLLYLKQQLPHMKCYGYELCKPGVELAEAAAKKFGLDVNYSQLDYVGGSESEYVFPKTDVSFTIFSLEQLPDTNKVAVENILRHTVYGSIHLEPVPEVYPFTLRGLIGRMDHWKANYLRNFDHNLSELENIEIARESIDSSHNPLMFPTLYVIKKA